MASSPLPSVYGFPYRWPGVPNVIPFAVSPGTSYLELLELYREYLLKLVPEFEDVVNSIYDEMKKFGENLEGWTQEHYDTFVSQITTLVNAINNRVGPTDVKHLKSTDNIVIDPTWPNNHVIWYEFAQDADGGRTPAFPSNVTGDAHINPEPYAVTRFMLWPTGSGGYVANNPWFRRSLVFDVRDFGAKGDGVTDDSNAVRLALLACVPYGGTVFFPSGDYVVNTALEVFSNTTITGAAATIRKTNNTYSLFYSLARGKTGYGSGATGIRINGLTFKGDLARGYTLSAYSSHRGADIQISDCTFDECARSGHVIDLQGCENVKVWGCTFRGIDPVAGREYVEAIQIDSSSANGVGFPGETISGEVWDGTATRNVRVWGNYFGPANRAGMTWPAQCPIGSHSYVDGRPYTGIVFENNTVEGVVSVEGVPYTGIIHFVGARGARVTGNRFISNGSRNSVFRAMGGSLATLLGDVANRESTLKPAFNPVQCDDVVFANNYCEGYHSANATVWVYGTEALRISNFTVERNVFEGCQGNSDDGAAIRGTFVDGVNVRDNKHRGGSAQHWFGWSYKIVDADNFSTNSLSQPWYSTGCRDVAYQNNEHLNSAGGPVFTAQAGLKVVNNRIHSTGGGHGMQIIGEPPFVSVIVVSGNYLTCASPEAGARPIYTNVGNYPTGLAVNNIGEKYQQVSLFAGTITASNNVNV